MSRDPRAALLACAEADGDIGEGALWIAAEDWADVDPQPWLDALDELGEELRTRLGSPAGEVPDPGLVHVVAALMRDRVKLRGVDGANPRAHYLHTVLARGAGIPIACAAVWIAVGRRAGVRVHGVGLPGHFVCQVGDTLVDPYDGGALLDAGGVRRVIEQALGRTIETIDPAWLQPAGTREMLARMSRNLRVCHAARSSWGLALRAADRCVALQPDAPAERRERGMLLWRAGLAMRALADLRDYLEAVPDAPDRESVERLLAEARGRVN